MGESVVALIALEADVMGGGTNPKHVAVDLERRFPDTQVIARGDDADRFGALPAVVLWPAKVRRGALGLNPSRRTCRKDI